MTRRIVADAISTVGFYRHAWLVVARGGWWKVPEIVQHLPLHVDVWDAHELLWAMAHRHRLLVTRGRGKTREYAVTRECHMPRGLQAGQAVHALTGAPMRSEAAA